MQLQNKVKDEITNLRAITKWENSCTLLKAHLLTWQVRNGCF